MLDLQQVPNDILKPNPRNARTHSKAQIRQLADSIATFGFVVPMLIDKDRSIIAGHGRHEAAKLLGLRATPCCRSAIDLAPGPAARGFLSWVGDYRRFRSQVVQIGSIETHGQFAKSPNWRAFIGLTTQQSLVE